MDSVEVEAPLRRPGAGAVFALLAVAAVALSALPAVAQIAERAAAAPRPNGETQLPLTTDFVANPSVVSNSTNGGANQTLFRGGGFNVPQGAIAFASVAMESGGGVPYIVSLVDNASNTYTLIANKTVGDMTLTTFMSEPAPYAEYRRRLHRRPHHPV